MRPGNRGPGNRRPGNRMPDRRPGEGGPAMNLPRRRWLSAAATAALAACAPRFQPMGPASVPARLTEDAIVAADGARLPLRRWTPEDGAPVRAVVVALHGFNDYSNAFDGVGRFLAGRGVAVLAYDQRGFGATADPGIWAGAETMIADAASAVRLTAAAHPGVPVFLMGESMGGAVAAAALTGDDPPTVAGAILSAPAVWGFSVMGFWPRTALKLAYAVLPGASSVPPPELGIRPSDNLPMLRALSADPLVIKKTRVDALYGLTELMGLALDALPKLRIPVLALYGGNEQVLAAEAVARARDLLAANPSATTMFYPDGWHMLMRDLQAARVLEDVAGWIDSRLFRN